MNRSSILILLTVLLNIGYAQKTNKVNAEYYLLDKKGNKISAYFSHIGEFSNQGYAIFAIGGNSVEPVMAKSQERNTELFMRAEKSSYLRVMNILKKYTPQILYTFHP